MFRKPILVARPSSESDLTDRMISSDEGYEIDIDIELPYFEICNEFDVWLQEMEARNNAARMAELGFSL